jgi:hypothetical protein
MPKPKATKTKPAVAAKPTSAAKATKTKPAVAAKPSAEPEVKSGPEVRYRSALAAFTASIEALYEIIGTIAPQAAALDDMTSRLDDFMKAQLGSVAAEHKPELERLGAHVALVMLRKVVANQPSMVNSLEERLTADAGESPEALQAAKSTIAAIKGEIEGPTLDGLPTDPEFGQAAQELIRGMSKMFTRRSRQSILLRSLLSAATEAFEAVLASTLESYYWTYPDAVGADREEFSLNDLREFDEIEDAIGVSISARVDSILRENWDDWNRFFKTNLKFELADISHDPDRLQEVFLRRNIVVHNNARVSKQYLRSPLAARDVKIGDLLEIDRDYLLQAVDELACAGVLLCVLTWATAMKPELPAASEELAAITYEWMREGRWAIVKTLCEVGQGRVSSNDARRTVFRLNRWLAIKRVEGVHAIEQELQAFDASALDPVYRVVKSALLDEDRASELALKAFDEGRLSRRELREWPVFEELRDRPAVAEIAFKLDAASIPGTESETERDVVPNEKSQRGQLH